MTDPLRPFADLIRTLWLAKKNGTAKTRSTPDTSKIPTGSPAPRSVRLLRTQLKARMAACSGAGPARMREAFVETVLLWELGDHLAPDPAFGEMVAHVSEQIASNPTVGERLNRVLARLAADPRR